MGVLMVLDEPEETLLDIRLNNAKRDAMELEDLLRQASRAASTDREELELVYLCANARKIKDRLAELISTRGK